MMRLLPIAWLLSASAFASVKYNADGSINWGALDLSLDHLGDGSGGQKEVNVGQETSGDETTRASVARDGVVGPTSTVRPYQHLHDHDADTVKEERRMGDNPFMRIKDRLRARRLERLRREGLQDAVAQGQGKASPMRKKEVLQHGTSVVEMDLDSVGEAPLQAEEKIKQNPFKPVATLDATVVGGHEAKADKSDTKADEAGPTQKEEKIAHNPFMPKPHATASTPTTPTTTLRTDFDAARQGAGGEAETTTPTKLTVDIDGVVAADGGGVAVDASQTDSAATEAPEADMDAVATEKVEATTPKAEAATAKAAVAKAAVGEKDAAPLGAGLSGVLAFVAIVAHWAL